MKSVKELRENIKNYILENVKTPNSGNGEKWFIIPEDSVTITICFEDECNDESLHSIGLDTTNNLVGEMETGFFLFSDDDNLYNINVLSDICVSLGIE